MMQSNYLRVLKGACTFVIACCYVVKAETVPNVDDSGFGSDNSAFHFQYPSKGVITGQGWNSFTEEGTPAVCVEVDIVPLEQSSFQTDVRQIHSTYSMHRSISTTVSASYKGAWSASASATTNRERKINTDFNNVLFSMSALIGSTFAIPKGSMAPLALGLDDKAGQLLRNVENGDVLSALTRRSTARPQQYRSGTIKLSAEAANILDAGDADKLEKFKRLCGDGFVAAIYRGARVELLLTHRYESREELESLQFSLGASGYGGKGRVSSSSTEKKFTDTNNLSYRIFQSGGIPIKPRAIPTQTPNDPKGFDVNSILPEPEFLMGNPTAFSVAVVPYSNIDLRADSINAPMNLMPLGDYYVILEDLYETVGNIVRELYDGYSTTETARDGTYDKVLLDVYGGVGHFLRLREEVHQDLILLERAIARCYETKKDCTVNEAFAEAKVAISSELANFREKSEEKRLELVSVKQKIFERISEIHAIKNNPAQAAYSGYFSNLLLRAESIVAPETTQGNIPKPKETDLPADSIRKIAEQLIDDIEKLSDRVQFEREVQNRLNSLIAHGESFAKSVSDTGELDDEFYLNFYVYLSQIPPKISDYVNNAANFGNLSALSTGFREVTTDEGKQLKADQVNSELASAVFRYRLMPWKEHLCEELKSGPLCLSDTSLLALTEVSDFGVRPENIREFVPSIAPAHVRRSNRPDLVNDVIVPSVILGPAGPVVKRIFKW